MMQTEFEVRILDIDKEKIVSKLKELNADFIGEFFQKRYVYDIVPPKKDAFLRLRDNGKSSTLTYKQRKGRGIDSTKEIEIEVSSFNQTKDLLQKIGYEPITYQENKRSSFELQGVQIELDKWPLIPLFIEVEGSSKQEVEKIVKLLGYKMEETTSMSILEVYKKYGIDLHDYDVLKF